MPHLEYDELSAEYRTRSCVPESPVTYARVRHTHNYQVTLEKKRFVRTSVTHKVSLVC
jgi:hypothetical protein